MGNAMDILMGITVALLGNVAILAMSSHLIWGA